MSSSKKESLTIRCHLAPIRTSREIHGVWVPWEVQSYQKDFEVASTVGGIFDLSHYTVIEISGKDAQDYLQRMTTVQFKTLDMKSVVHGAFLNGRGGCIALGVFKRLSTDGFQIIILESLKERLLEHIEQFHFSEQFSVRDVGDKFTVLGCWSVDGKLAARLALNPELTKLQTQQVEVFGVTFEAWRDVRRLPLYWMMVESIHGPRIINEWVGTGVSLLGTRLFEYFRIQAGVPEVGQELTEKDIILEGNFDEAVARNKGCYPGQEVVERIFTYGQVNRKLQRVTLWGEQLEKAHRPMSFKLEEKEVGELVSMEPSPSEPKTSAGLMFVKREFWDSGAVWSGPDEVKAKLTD